MKIHELNGKNICILGYAREGQAMHAALKTYAPKAAITIADQNPAINTQGAAQQLGKNYLHNLNVFDVIIRSSGIPFTAELQAVETKVTDMTQIFFDTIADTGVTTIGITGTKGKSTTSNLIYHALKTTYPDTFFMGNIGEPMIQYIAKAKANAFFVIELSSYMLERLNRSPHIAVVTSFFAEHLDRYGSRAAYLAAKQNIAAHQTTHDYVLFNSDYPECKQIADAGNGREIAYTAADFPLSIDTTKLRGEHNRANLAAALTVATLLKVPKNAALHALQHTSSLPYRLVPVGTYNGIHWVDDSLATAPEATLFALKALGDTVDTLITGGMDRGGYDFTALGAYIAASSVRNIILFPDTGDAIKAAAQAAKPKTAKTYYYTTNMNDAVAFAKAHTKKGATCLLSNASPSYNLFKNHEDKSSQFSQAIKKL